jgi:hypothetical protein
MPLLRELILHNAMLRDLTMIFSVFVSIASLGFGVYKNIEAGNAKGFVYEQAYRVIAAVNKSSIGPVAKASIVDAALSTFATPPPVIDLSRSSADTTAGTAVCSETLIRSCVSSAGQLAMLNALCISSKGAGDACAQATQMKLNIDGLGCLNCFTR